MADINISNLSGSDLFDDAESFMSEINNEATDSIVGGLNINCRYTANCNQGTLVSERLALSSNDRVFLHKGYSESIYLD